MYYRQLAMLIEFIYIGEVNVMQEDGPAHHPPQEVVLQQQE